MGYKSDAQRKAVHASKAEKAALKLTAKQKKLDKNNNGKIDAADLRMLREGTSAALLKYCKK
tara:strand:+ start:166 stop:351 length:186 start_codon:yes stop_codon:yes gene_type:complete